jgi:hypothetical protein
VLEIIFPEHFIRAHQLKQPFSEIVATRKPLGEHRKIFFIGGMLLVAGRFSQEPKSR